MVRNNICYVVNGRTNEVITLYLADQNTVADLGLYETHAPLDILGSPVDDVPYGLSDILADEGIKDVEQVKWFRIHYDTLRVAWFNEIVAPSEVQMQYDNYLTELKSLVFAIRYYVGFSTERVPLQDIYLYYYIL